MSRGSGAARRTPRGACRAPARAGTGRRGAPERRRCWPTLGGPNDGRRMPGAGPALLGGPPSLDLIEDGNFSGSAGEPLLLELLQRPVVDHLLQHPVDVLPELASLLEDDAPVLVRDELADDDEVVGILADEARCDGEVDHERVNRLVEERLVRGRRRREDAFLLRGLDGLADVTEAGRGLLGS